MVAYNNFLDVIDALLKSDSFRLPAYKQNPFKIEYGQNDNIKHVYNGSEPLLPFADSEVINASITDWRRLTALEGDCKAVYEVTLDVEDSNLNFKAGDTIGVIPHNDRTDVDHIITCLDLFTTSDLSYTLSVDSSVKGGKIPPHVPVRSTLRHVLTHFLDLRSVLKKLFLLALSQYTKDEKERKILQYLCSKEGSAAYTSHILNKNLCLLDILTIFKSCKPPVEVILANLPRLIPRPYSVINSGLISNKHVKICFSVMTTNNRRGLTTGWLENIISKEESTLESKLEELSLTEKQRVEKIVPIYLRKNISGFAMPEDLETPLILIGPGTGVSPYIGFLEERQFAKVNNPEKNVGEVWLFFGCRNPELDFIYKTELDIFLSNGTLTKLNAAFSRVENNNIKYIQDAMKEKGKEVTSLINNGAAIFICGDLKMMAAEVKDILINSFIVHCNLSEEDAQKKILDLQKNKRYFVDAWS